MTLLQHLMTFWITIKTYGQRAAPLQRETARNCTIKNITPFTKAVSASSDVKAERLRQTAPSEDGMPMQ